MKVKLRQIGHSLGIIIPKDFLQVLDLGKGDFVDLSVKEREISLVLKRKAK